MQSSQFASSAIKTTAPNPIRVVLIEDLREVREGLAALINGTSGFQCTGSYFSMEAALNGRLLCPRVTGKNRKLFGRILKRGVKQDAHEAHRLALGGRPRRTGAGTA